MEPKRQKMNRKSSLYKNENHAGNLNNMRLNNKWCDITIRVSEIEYQAHKVVLAANLKYFDTMLSNDSFKESKQDVIPMEDVQGSDLEAFVSYAYTGEMLLTETNALGLLELANYLGEDGIKDACIAFLNENLRKEEACRAYKFANALDCLTLKNVAKVTILSNFTDCSQNTEYLNFEFEQLVDILSDGKTQSVDSQQKYFEGIMRWIMFDMESRRICMDDLLNSIDILKLSADYLLHHLYNNVIDFNDEHGIMKDVMLCYQSNKSQQMRSQALMILGFSVKESLLFQFCSLAKKNWSPVENFPFFHKWEHSRGAVLNDKFYYCGKYDGKMCLNVFNPTTKRNATLPLLNSSISILSYSSLCTYRKCLYLCGGFNKDKLKSNQVLKYDPQTNSFETLPPMATAKSGAAAIFFQDCLYVLGGKDETSKLNLVEKYDPNTNEWMPFPSMREARHRHAVAALDGKLYVCGRKDENRVEVYDPSKNNWQLVASMKKQRRSFLLVVHEGKLLVIGGDEDKGKTIEVYDPSEDEWQIDQELSSGLQIRYPRGGVISLGCAPNAD